LRTPDEDAEASLNYLQDSASEAEAWSYNVLQRLTYLFVIFVLFPLMIWTGLAAFPAACHTAFFITWGFRASYGYGASQSRP